MALSQQQKDELAEEFRNVDLYDPTKDPKQDTSNFMPKMPHKEGCDGSHDAQSMCNGGYAGMQNGGLVKEASDFPIMSELMKMSPDGNGMADNVVHMADGGPVFSTTDEPSLDDPFSVDVSSDETANVEPPTESFDPDQVDIHSGSSVKSAINSAPSNPETNAQHGTHPAETL